MSGAASSRPNVLLVVLDSVRARNTSLHGHVADTTPFLVRFAGESTVYEQARAPGTESISSHTSLFTGLHVREHGITNRRHRLREGVTVWEWLADEFDYETGVFSNNPFITELPVGLKDAFSTVVGRRSEFPFPEAVNPKEFVLDADGGVRRYLEFASAALENGNVAKSLANGLSFKLPERYEDRLPELLQSDASAGVYADRFLEWEREQAGPWAACVNFMDAHYPYEPARDHDRWGGPELRRLQSGIADQAWEFVGGQRPWWQRRALEGLYDGAIHQMDAQVERVVETLRERGVLSETLVVVTADHGEGFGEQSLLRPDVRVVGHGNGGVDEALLHVPLLVRAPCEPGGDRVREVASLTRFRAVVETAVAGDDPVARGFVPEDGRVLSCTDGVDPDSRDQALAYCENVETLTTEADVVYRDDGDGGVEKAARWGDVAARIWVRDAQTAYRVGDGGGDVVADALASLEDADVGVEATAGVSEDVKRRLEDLGYA